MIRFTDEKVKAINTEYKELCRYRDLKINLGSGLNGDSIYMDNWMICTIENLDKMITELTAMKQAIENTTGVILQ